MKEQKKKSKALTFIFIPVILIIFLSLFLKPVNDKNTLVVYCSHDSVFAEAILKDFTEKTGIKIIPRFDTEASKSLGLTEKILFEKEKSECDVYWSNEILSMPVLQQANLLSPYKGTGYNRIPQKYKDPEGYWCGFAARMRVVIYNKNLFKGSYEDFRQNMADGDLSKTAIALPLYGTTLTHFAAIWQKEGPDKLKSSYRDWKKRGIQIVPGNGPSRNLVANGTCETGWTDTDDYFGAVDNEAPVAMFPCRLSDNSTIIIPNTVGIIKSTTKKEAAQKFVDFLLSEEIEVKLAKSASRQIPLGKTTAELPDQVKALLPFVSQGTDLSKIHEVRNELLDWLKREENLK